MNDISAEVTVTGSHGQPANQIGRPARPASRSIYIALVAGAAFGLYWLSSFVLQGRSATTNFGADTWFYAVLAEGNVIDRIAGNYHLDRIARFHPTTVAMMLMIGERRASLMVQERGC